MPAVGDFTVDEPTPVRSQPVICLPLLLRSVVLVERLRHHDDAIAVLRADPSVQTQRLSVVRVMVRATRT